MSSQVVQIIVGVFAATILFQTSALAAPYGVDARGSTSTSIPSTSVDGNGNAVLTGGFHTVSTNFDTGSVLLQDFYVAPLNQGSNQQITYRDLKEGGVYTDTAEANINSLSYGLGELHGWIEAKSIALDPNTQGLNGATADAYLLWTDTLIVSSSTLPVGAPVSLQISNNLFGYLHTSGNGQSALSFYSFVGGSSGQSATFSDSYSSQQTSLNVQQSKLLNTTVGATLTLEEQLNLQASGVGNYVGSINAGDTAFLNIQSLTQGATFTSASGVDYSTVGITPVPIPSSLFLFATGMLSLWGFCRWQRPTCYLRGVST